MIGYAITALALTHTWLIAAIADLKVLVLLGALHLSSRFIVAPP
jgi:hypothetical protein